MPSSKTDFLSRLRKYCALTERCTYDVQKKMMEWDVPEEDRDRYMDSLYQDTFVDDGRYARSFANDQWQFQQWGRIKIRHALIQKQLEEASIQKALDNIPVDAYVEMVHKSLVKKWQEYDQAKGVVIGRKILSFARQRGYEDDLVFPWLEEKGLLEGE